MAEKIVFGADIDNVTIKNIDGKLTAIVDVENAEDELEVTTNDPTSNVTEDRTHYIETEAVYLIHKSTGAYVGANRVVQKERAAPLHEILSNSHSAIEFINDTDKVYFNVDRSRNYYSGLDNTMNFGATLTDGAPVMYKKSEYTAKTLNEFLADKTLSITTPEREAINLEGRPYVLETTHNVVYPEIPYVEKTITSNTTTTNTKLIINSYESINSVTEGLIHYVDSELRTLVSEYERGKHTVHYTLTTVSGETLQGSYEFTNQHFDRTDIADYKNHTIQSERWEFEPITLKGFYGNYTVAPKSFVAEH